jgi:predicted metal-dependent hydrolase
MVDKIYAITDKKGQEVEVHLRRDKRLKKTSRWELRKDGTILLRVPGNFSSRQVPELLKTISEQLEKVLKRAKRFTDADLAKRARYVNRKYFNNEIEWNAIRWIKPMKTRLGSFTSGGATDGYIRISEEIKTWPQWVIDYVIAHELAHRVHPYHGKKFWEFLTQAYPLTEQARGFIKGVSFTRGKEWEEAE